MIKKYKVIITPQAQQQLMSIRDYILLELKSPIAARNTLTALEAAIKMLDRMPNRIPLTDEEKWREYGVHKMPVQNFLVYFTVNEDDLTVYVIAVVYARRDQKKALEETLL